MLTKNECDLIWKIRHGAIPTGRFFYGCEYSDSPNCKYWRSGGTHCVVTLFKTQYVNLLKSGMHLTYSVKWKMAILFLSYIFKIVIFYIT